MTINMDWELIGIKLPVNKAAGDFFFPSDLETSASAKIQVSSLNALAFRLKSTSEMYSDDLDIVDIKQRAITKILM